MSSVTAFSDFGARLRAFISTSIAEYWASSHPRSISQGHAGSDGRFNELSLELFGLQFEHNTPYRQLCHAKGIDPGRVRHWSRIPAIPASAFKEFEVSCLPIRERTRVFWSSGTGQQPPSRHFHNAESLAIYEASLLPWFEAHLRPELPSPAPVDSLSSSLGHSRGDRPGEGQARCLSYVPHGSGSDESCRRPVLCLTPPLEQVPNSSLVHMFQTVGRVFGLPDPAFLGRAGNTEWAVDVEAAVAALEQSCAEKKPSLILGTAFSFVHLLDSLAARGTRIALPEGSSALETGGYKGRSRALPRAELHSLLSQRLGLRPDHIVSEYGMSELSSQAYDHVAGSSATERFFQFPPWARVQIISPETEREAGDGESGLIRVFDLANFYSAMAIQTEDLGVRGEAGGFQLIGRVERAESRGCSLMSLP